jgi:hypothetical protein
MRIAMMQSIEARLSELVIRCEELHRQGRTVSAADLCADCPELLEDLQERLRVLRDLGPLLDTSTEIDRTDPSGVVAGGWAGEDYEILGELGRGGMGVVYRAFDRRRGQVVALKALPRLGPLALYRFKREFRALADVAHPNLVALHEVVSDGADWFFTMELVEGVDFLTHVRPGGGAPRLDRLRRAIRQLAEGVTALHAAGKLHRDLKSSNVRVTPSGRVVILDFGLAAELGPDGQHQSTEQHILGTVAYMSPEQSAGLPVGPATDWYSVGVIIYEALTGHLPFTGTLLEVLARKQNSEPPPPGALVGGTNEDLDALCLELLRREPRARPTGHEILQRLEDGPPKSECVAPSLIPGCQQQSLVGRDRHLRTLAAAFDEVIGGRAVALFIHGRSGQGKTTLARHFLDELVARDAAVVLTGRCYERESVPYKALDSVVDALAQYLKHIPVHEARELLPRDILSLARVFPVLGCVKAIAGAPRRPYEVPDLQELRRRAFAALRELLARLGDRRHLVLHIDDLQWGDLDSAALLIELLRPPAPPVLLFLGIYRSEDENTSPFLKQLREVPKDAFDRRYLAVGALAPFEARDLALALLGREDPQTRDLANTIARESQGHPLFVHELSRRLEVDIRNPNRSGPASDVTLDDVLWARIGRLPEEARRLLEVVAVSGHPLGQSEACRAAGLGAEASSALALLRSERLVRGRGPAESSVIETYHDSIRESVTTHLAAPLLRDHHIRLALVLETSGGSDPESLAIHFRGGDRPERAGEYYVAAADQAVESLAFDRAANLYRQALSLPTSDDANRLSLREMLAHALANSGRGAEAAEVYMAAAEATTTARALDLRREAAGQLLMSGHIDEGLVVLRDVLRAVGIRFPSTLRRTLLSLLIEQVSLRLRGLGFRPRDEAQIPGVELAQIDTCWSAAVGLSNIDIIRGAYFQSRSLILALRAGEMFRIARALALEAAHASTRGGSDCRHPAKVLRVADRIIGQFNQPYTTGLLWLARGIVAYLECRHGEAQDFLGRAAETLSRNAPGGVWEVDTSNIYTLWSLADMGEIAELVQRRSVLLREARDRGDLYAEANLSTYTMPIARLSAGEPDEAAADLNSVMSRWSQRGYYLQHKNALVAKVMIELYRQAGSGLSAWNSISREWQMYSASMLHRVKFNRIDIHQLRGRSAVAAARCTADPRDLLRIAHTDARQLESEKTPYSMAMANVVRAGVAAVSGDLGRARIRLLEAPGKFEALGLRLWASAARRRLGELLGGDEGRELVARADAWMTAQTIRDPARITAMLIPGFRHPDG